MPRHAPRPIAETKTVGALVDLVVSGRIRIPVYQRNLRWDAEDVLSLFDSIYHGIPVGVLLLYERPAPAARLELGPLVVHADEQAIAYDVIDGQQRLVALAASLRRPSPIPATPDDPHVVYFDPVEQEFVGPPATGEIPETWMPAPYLFELSELLEWLANWKCREDESLRRVILEARARILEYEIPLYTVVAEQDSDWGREIFLRINASGKPLEWSVVHAALTTREQAAEPSTIDDLADALIPVGMGRLRVPDLQSCLAELNGDIVRALPTLRRVLGFLRNHVGIGHLQLLPGWTPVPVLARFFHLHPIPKPRSLELLTRWSWRRFLADSAHDASRESQAIDHDEERSVQRLLALAPRDERATSVPRRFDLTTSEGRIALLGLVALGPRDLATERPLDVAALLEDPGRNGIPRPILGPTGDLSLGLANRILLPGVGLAHHELLEYMARKSGANDRRRDLVSSSHAISPSARAALVSGDTERFLTEREQALNEALRSLVRRRAAWARSDRPSIDYILESTK